MWVDGVLRALPFLLGAAGAGILFAVVIWDLGHHGDGYSRNGGHSHPWLRDFYLFYMIWGTGWALIRIPWLRRWRSRRWPWAKTRIEGGAVEDFAKRRYPVFRLTVTYSYSVGGEEYGGVYTESFGNKSDAQGMLKSLRDLPPPTRYNANNPAESAMEPYRDATLA